MNKYSKLLMGTFLLGVIFIIIGMYYSLKKISWYSYQIKRAVSYKVILKPNSFYSNNILDSNLYYPAKIVKDFNINFNYKKDYSKNINSNYSYNIKAQLVGKVKDDNGISKEIWIKDYNLKNNTLKNYQNKIEIKENVLIDYDYFYNLVESFQVQYGLLLDADLKIKLSVVDNENSDEINIDIPITKNVTQVNKDYEKESKVEIYKDKQIKIVYYIVGLGLTLSSLLMGVSKKKSIYTKNTKIKEVRKIIKDYKDIIIKSENDLNLNNLIVIDIKDIKDLIKVAQINNTNIIMTNQYIFYVLKENIIYRLIF